MPKKSRRPGYLLHKASGRARVVLDGKDVYLGDYGSEESYEEYHKVVTRWLADKESLSSFNLTIDVLCLKYLEFADQHYRKHGEPTTEPTSIRISLRYLLDEHASVRADKFGPKSLKQVRELMIKARCVRTSINCMIGRIRRMFKWASSEELVDQAIWLALKTVDGLQAGRGDAVESEPILPVEDARVDAIRYHVSRQVWAMIELQRLTGARPGEVALMRTADINQNPAVWEYYPGRYKTEHHNRDRVVFLGPLAQQILAPFLRPDKPHAYLFSPAEAKAEFQANRKAKRETPMTPSQRRRKQMADPKRKPGERYTITSYDQAVRKGCEKAFGMPAELRKIPKSLANEERRNRLAQAAEWRAVHCWHPNQLRHSCGTRVRREFGLEASQVVLGHATADVTQIYAERDREKARDVMQKSG